MPYHNIVVICFLRIINLQWRLHNSQLTVKALSHLVLGQRWFSLGYLSLKDKTKHKGFFSEQPREYTNEKSEWRFIYFQPKVESMMVYFSHFIPGEAGKKSRQYKIIMQKYVNLSKELFNLFHELSRTQRNISRRLKKRIMWNWFALWKKKLASLIHCLLVEQLLAYVQR